MAVDVVDSYLSLAIERVQFVPIKKNRRIKFEDWSNLSYFIHLSQVQTFEIRQSQVLRQSKSG